MVLRYSEFFLLSQMVIITHSRVKMHTQFLFGATVGWICANNLPFVIFFCVSFECNTHRWNNQLIRKLIRFHFLKSSLSSTLSKSCSVATSCLVLSVRQFALLHRPIPLTFSGSPVQRLLYLVRKCLEHGIRRVV